jgi:uncharacterized protein YqgV (UPF0045/DUF77 family)
MVVSAQVSLYPLAQESLSLRIGEFCARLRRAGLEPAVGPMSTVVTGEAATLFPALQAAFADAAEAGPVVMALTVSNACPI